MKRYEVSVDWKWSENNHHFTDVHRLPLLYDSLKPKEPFSCLCCVLQKTHRPGKRLTVVLKIFSGTAFHLSLCFHSFYLFSCSEPDILSSEDLREWVRLAAAAAKQPGCMPSSPGEKQLRQLDINNTLSHSNSVEQSLWATALRHMQHCVLRQMVWTLPRMFPVRSLAQWVCLEEGKN